MTFRDHFSGRAEDYARYRPTYPAALYAQLAAIAPATRRAWDCATGSGQAAVGLAAHFEHVLATDASPQQLLHAAAHPRVDYVLALAERIPARSACFDLVTVAAAAHWVDLEAYYAEVRRVVQPGGVLALWSYYDFESERRIDAIMDRYAHQEVGRHWPERMIYNQTRYADLPFPFRRLEMPTFHAEADWELERVLGYMRTWSASQRYHAAHGKDPIDLVRDDLERAWGDPQRRVHLRWRLHLLVGRVGT